MNTYKEVWEEIIKHENITIVTHIMPDADTIGSATALKHLILENTDNKNVKISSDKAPRYVSFLEESEGVSDEFFNSSQVIVVDTSTKSRFYDKRVVAERSIKIDHHPNEGKWKLEIGGDNWPATGQVLYELAKELKLKINKRAAEALWVAIWTDTEGMTQRNPSSTTIEAIKTLVEDKEVILNKLKLSKEEQEHINKLSKELVIKDNVCYLLSDDIVPNDYIRQMTALFSNKEGFEVYIGITKNNDHCYRGELRSKSKVDVSTFARVFGGGGHFNSSGFKAKSLEEGKKNIEYLINNLKF